MTNEFDTAKKIEPKSSVSNNPMIFIPNQEADNIGAKVVGTFLIGKEFPKKEDPTKFNYFVEMRIEKADKVGSVTIKQGTKYVDAVWKEGDIVTLFCQARLWRSLNQLSAGDRFQAVYQGMKRTPGGKGAAAHHFDVRSIAGKLSNEDREYIEARQEKAKNLIADTAKAAEEAELEAKAAMSQLED